MSDHENFDCRVGYTQTYHPASGEGARHGKSAFRTAGATVFIPVVDPGQAPVAASLVRADGLGTFDVRYDGAAHLRPLRAPGSWDPCTVEAFRAASAGDVPWLDGPFHVDPWFAQRPTSLSSFRTDLGDVAVRRWANDSTEERRVADAHDRVRHLKVIDGVVHVICPEPTLQLSWFQGATERLYEVTWRIGALDQDDDPKRGSPRAPGARAKESPRWTRRIGHDFHRRESGIVGVHLMDALRFRVDQVDGAAATLEDWMTRRTEEEAAHRGRFVRREVVATCDPSLLRVDDGFGSLMRALKASFHRNPRSFVDDVAPNVWLGRDTAGRAEQDPGVLGRWERAGEMARALPAHFGSEEAREVVEAAMSVFDEIVPGNGHPTSELRWLRSRWEAFDRHRDLTVALDPGASPVSDLSGLVL